MATYTSYLNLEKPAVGETFNLLKINQNWDKIDQGVSSLNSKLVPTYSSVTLASGITGSVTIMRMGKLRVLMGYFNPNTSGASITIATLDAQDKPPVNIQGTFSGYGVTATGELNINTAGTFQCSVNAAPSNTLKFNIAYAVS